MFGIISNDLNFIGFFPSKKSVLSKVGVWVERCVNYDRRYSNLDVEYGEKAGRPTGLWHLFFKKQNSFISLKKRFSL